MDIIRLSSTMQRVFKLFDTQADAETFARVCREDWTPYGCDTSQEHEWRVCRACDTHTGKHCGYVVTDEWGHVTTTEFYDHAIDIYECNRED